MGVRMPCTFLVMFGSRFNWKEKLFFAIAWSPKVGDERLHLFQCDFAEACKPRNWNCRPGYWVRALLFSVADNI